MRCPYCGSLNGNQSKFCVRCGRDLTKPGSSPATQPPTNYPPQPAQPPYQPPRSTPPKGKGAQIPGGRNATPASSRTASTRPPALSAEQILPLDPTATVSQLEPPAPFPPHKIEHLQALQQGALSYTVLHDDVSDGKKKIVRIVYPRCTPWQEVATLLKAFSEHASPTYNTILVQGFYDQTANGYAFTHGQLQFDRNVILGSQRMNRYQIETGSGFERDSERIVLYE